VADFNQIQSQKQSQIQKISQVQIQALSILAMNTEDIRSEIYKIVNENPALEIVSRKKNASVDGRRELSIHGSNQLALESAETHGETLQGHLMHQLNSMNLSMDEMELSRKLIYNLDKNGFYGTMLSPESLINKTRPVQTKEMLDRCIARIQSMDPIGTCCKSPEESLFVQAKLMENAPELSLFILDGHIELLNPPAPETVYKKLQDYQKEWHKKSFAQDILLDKIEYDEDAVAAAIQFILRLNIHPAQDYLQDTNSEYESPDVVLRVEKKSGIISESDYTKGIVKADNTCYFQISYASGALPELRLAPDFSIDKENYQKAKSFLDILAFRESSLVLQGCAIVNAQKDFFLKGPEYISALTRREIAEELGIHESTVSRFSAKKSSKYIDTEWGNYPVNYFFSSGVPCKSDGKKVSSEIIKMKIAEKLSENKNLSDLKLTELLNADGIQIARRTVAKYRKQIGMGNLYKR